MTAIYELTSVKELDELLNTEKLLLIDFWAPWCTSCKAMMPIVESLVIEKPDVLTLVKVNADKFEDVAERFSVRGLPCVVLYKHQQELLRITDLFTANQLKKKLAPWLSFEYLELINQANNTQNHEAALVISKKAIAIAPQQSQVHSAYVQRLLAIEEGVYWRPALEYIEQLNHDVLRDPEISRLQSYLNLVSKASGYFEQLLLDEERKDFERNIQPVFKLLLVQDYVQALEKLSALVLVEAGPEYKELIIQILNVMPDRKLAHDQRLKLFELIK